MKRKNLVLCVGAPGTGKSTWLRTHLGEGETYVSRDEVRFSMVDEGEDYFSHETEVFQKFVEKIEENLNKGLRVFADATHINWASRRKLIKSLHNCEEIDIDCYVFQASLETCLERNSQRSGRSFVPKAVVKRMKIQTTHPSTDPFKYHFIKEIKEDE